MRIYPALKLGVPPVFKGVKGTIIEQGASTSRDRVISLWEP